MKVKTNRAGTFSRYIGDELEVNVVAEADCGDGFIHMSKWSEEDRVWIQFWDNQGPSPSFWWRIKQAFRLIRQAEPHAIHFFNMDNWNDFIREVDAAIVTSELARPLKKNAANLVDKILGVGEEID